MSLAFIQTCQVHSGSLQILLFYMYVPPFRIVYFPFTFLLRSSFGLLFIFIQNTFSTLLFRILNSTLYASNLTNIIWQAQFLPNSFFPSANSLKFSLHRVLPLFPQPISTAPHTSITTSNNQISTAKNAVEIDIVKRLG